MSMPPHMRGGFPHQLPQQPAGRRVAVSAADEWQQMQEAQDHKLAKMLQAQEMHRAQHPSHLAHGHGGGHSGDHGHGLPAMLAGGGLDDPEMLEALLSGGISLAQ